MKKNNHYCAGTGKINCNESVFLALSVHGNLNDKSFWKRVWLLISCRHPHGFWHCSHVRRIPLPPRRQGTLLGFSVPLVLTTFSFSSVLLGVRFFWTKVLWRSWRPFFSFSELWSPKSKRVESFTIASKKAHLLNFKQKNSTPIRIPKNNRLAITYFRQGLKMTSSLKSNIVIYRYGLVSSFSHNQSV